MLGFQEYERRRFRLHIALFRLDDQELDLLPVPPRERLGYKAGDVLVLQSFDSGAVYLEDQLPHLQAAGVERGTVFLNKKIFLFTHTAIPFLLVCHN